MNDIPIRLIPETDTERFERLRSEADDEGMPSMAERLERSARAVASIPGPDLIHEARLLEIARRRSDEAARNLIRAFVRGEKR